jgi:hypothetical protein
VQGNGQGKGKTDILTGVSRYLGNMRSRRWTSGAKKRGCGKAIDGRRPTARERNGSRSDGVSSSDSAACTSTDSPSSAAASFAAPIESTSGSAFGAVLGDADELIQGNVEVHPAAAVVVVSFRFPY